MRRIHLVLSGRAAEHLDELREFWQESTGEMPSLDALIQRALADYHQSYMGSLRDSDRSARKPAQSSSRPNPDGPARRSRAGRGFADLHIGSASAPSLVTWMITSAAYTWSILCGPQHVGRLAPTYTAPLPAGCTPFEAESRQ